jgi:iron complex outermembrane receptor protein
LAAPGQQGQFLSTQDTRYRSLFAQATWNASARWLLGAGLRWQQETKRMWLKNTLNDATPSVIALLLAPPSVNGSARHNSSGGTWSLTPQYRWDDHTLLYVTAAQGFQSGGFNTGFGAKPVSQREYKDQDVLHFEAGIKSSLWAERMRWRFDVFHTEYRNYQEAAFISSQFQVSNAERADLNGFELEGDMALTDNLMLNAAISYADFIYAKNTHGQCDPFRQPDSSTQAGACDLSGKHPINAPPWKTQLGAQWLQPAGAGQFYEQFAWEWTDSYNTTSSLDPHQVQRAYNWLNLRVGFRWSHYDIAAWVDNALNETVVDIAAVQNLYAGPGDGSVQTYLQDGRSYGVTLRASY